MTSKPELEKALADFQRLCDSFDAYVLNPDDDGKALLMVLAEVEPSSLHHLADTSRRFADLLPVECEQCGGNKWLGWRIHGAESHADYPCPACHGLGKVWNPEVVERAIDELDGALPGHFFSKADLADAVRAVLAAITEEET